MKTILGLAAALACGVGLASAAEGPALSTAVLPPRAIDLAALQPAQAKAAGNNERGGVPQANPLRAYPPSCASVSLPDKPSADAIVKDVTVLAVKGNRPVTETVKVFVWRIPCSSSGTPTRYSPEGGPNAMTLVRIERSAELTDQFYVVPQITAAQGAIEFGKTNSLLRLAPEPNTRTAETLSGQGLFAGTTFVLENLSFPEAGYFQFNKAFKLRVDPRNAYVATNAVDFDIPAYAPPANPAPMLFDGYAAAQWINAEKGHGLLVQVTESDQYPAGAAMVRQLVYDLLLKDLDGNPFWLVGSAAVPAGASSVTLDAAYLGKDLEQKPWGKATFQLKHCNRLEVTFTPNADLAAPVPSFDGTIAYDRLFSANGMLCE